MEILLQNKKAYFDYTVLQKEIAGIVLLSTEVKSILLKKASLIDCFVYIEENRVVLKNFIVEQYQVKSNYTHHDRLRNKILLLTSNQIKKWKKETQIAGVTIIPLSIGLVGGRLKMEIGLVKGKKLYNKKEAIKERDIKRFNEKN